MPAPTQGLVPETRRAEADHAELKRKIEALSSQYDNQMRLATIDLRQKSKAAYAEFERQHADIASQLAKSLRGSVEAVLRQKLELELDALQRAHREQEEARTRAYNEQRQKYEQAIFTTIDALIFAGSAPSSGHLPVLPSRPSDVADDARAAAAGQALGAETNPAPLAAAEVPSQAPVATPLPTPTKTPKESGKPLPVPSQSGPSENALGRPPPQSPAAYSQAAPTAPLHPRNGVDELELASAQSPANSAQSSATPVTPVLELESPPAEALSTAPAHDQPSPASDVTQKRKANGESIDQSAALTPNPAKRAKLERPIRANNAATPHSPAPELHHPPKRTVSFEEVYGVPGKPPQYNHVIVRYPVGTGDFYILRCDEHGVHFGEHPLRGAAKHLASAQHGYMSKAHATAIETLGHRVLGCTQEMADRHNHAALNAFKGGYKAFNANNLSQARRAELGFPPLDPLASQKAATQRKLTAGVTDPASCRFYVCTGGELKFPVLILPWGDLSPAGLVGTLADIGFFREVTEDGKSLGVPKLPKCYVYDEGRGGILGILGWAKGYESGGPLEKKREFPVLCAENPDYRMWHVGWVKAAQLSPLDFDDPTQRSVPYFREARGYYYNRILRLKNAGLRGAPATQGYGTSTPQQSRARHAEPEDVDMRDAGDVEGESDRDSVSRTILTDSDRGIGRADADSRRTSFSTRDELPGSAISTPAAATNAAQLIAAQALNLQGPARGGFKAINAGSADGGPSPSARESLEPPSKAGSVSSAGGGKQHRRVYKIHARSSNRPAAQLPRPSPSIVLPERPAEGSMSPRAGEVQGPNEARRPSPASLQNIVQGFSTPAAGSPRVGSPSPKPATTRRPLPSAPMRSGSPSRSALLSAVSAKLVQPLRDSRAGSAPVQPSEPKDPMDAETRSFASASALPGLSRHGTPQPSASASTPDPAQKRASPAPPVQLPSLSATLPPMLHLRTTPLATPTASASNTRSNSPTPAQQAKSATPTTAAATTTSSAKPETPSLTPTVAQQPPPAAFLPSMDVFDLAGAMEGATEIFRASAPGQTLRLIDDRQSGVLATPSDAAVALRIDAKKVKTAERLSVQGGAVCVVTLIYQGEGEAEGARQTLVLEKARSTASGMLNGMVHARRLCRRLVELNPGVACPPPKTDLSSVQWRFDSPAPTPTPSTPAPEAATGAAPTPVAEGEVE